jgi:hypothetical protein
VGWRCGRKHDIFGLVRIGVIVGEGVLVYALCGKSNYSRKLGVVGRCGASMGLEGHQSTCFALHLGKGVGVRHQRGFDCDETGAKVQSY